MNKKFWNKKRVFITGYEGFLGSNLTKALIEARAKVFGIDIITKRKQTILCKADYAKCKISKIDIADYSALEKAVNSFKPQIIFHLAAEAIVSRAFKDPTRAFKSNIQGTWNILEICRGKRFVESVIVASSDKAYGSSLKLPYTESTPLKGEFPYDASKSCTDILANSYYQTYQCPVCIMRCGNIYGPGDFHFTRLVPDAIRAMLKNKQFVIRSDGKFTRDYVYVQDTVEGYLMLAEKAKRKKLFGEAFNLSNEKPVSVLKFCKVLSEVSGRKIIAPKILNKAKCEIRNQYLCAKKVRKVLGWKPKYNLKQGLIETIKWYKKIHDYSD